MNPSCKLPCYMMLHEQFEQENVANSIGMTGSKSKMLQIPLKRQLPAPKCSFQLQNAANSNENRQKKQIQQKNPKTELNNSQNNSEPFVVPTQLFASKMDISRIWLWLNVDVSHHKCPKVLSEFIFAFFPDECVTFVTWKKRSDSNIFPVIQSYWSKFSPWIPVQGLCGRLLRRDPEARWTAEEALHHSWFYSVELPRAEIPADVLQRFQWLSGITLGMLGIDGIDGIVPSFSPWQLGALCTHCISL